MLWLVLWHKIYIELLLYLSIYVSGFCLLSAIVVFYLAFLNWSKSLVEF